MGERESERIGMHDYTIFITVKRKKKIPTNCDLSPLFHFNLYWVRCVYGETDFFNELSPFSLKIYSPNFYFSSFLGFAEAGMNADRLRIKQSLLFIFLFLCLLGHVGRVI